VEIFILDQGFRGFSPWLTSFVVFGSVVRHSIMVEGCDIQKGERGRKKEEKRRERERRCFFPEHIQTDLLPLLRPHLITMPPYYKSIKGLIH
jgi:hypothetical protein